MLYEQQANNAVTTRLSRANHALFDAIESYKTSIFVEAFVGRGGLLPDIRMFVYKRLLGVGKRTLSKSGAKVQKIFDICKFWWKNRPLYAEIGRFRKG